MFLKGEKIFTNIILIAFFVVNIITLTYGECFVRLDEDISLRPKFKLTFGTRKVDVTVNRADTRLSLFDKQEGEAQCDTKFEYPKYLSNEHSLRFHCDGDYLRVNDGHNFDQGTFKCSSQKWNLYETLQNFVWCPSNMTSYLLARPFGSKTLRFQYLAGICYDTFNLSFKSLFYTMATKHSEHLHPIFLSHFYKLGVELKYLKETFNTKSINERDYDGQDIQDWLIYSKYNYSSIVQNTLLLGEFNNEFGSLLDLAWWPNLRLGNWKRYEAALTQQVESQQQSYDILSGVSAAASVPIIEKCQSNFTLKELTENRFHKIPLYVWNYLRSRTNSSDEIVIIGVNTPFYEFYLEEDVIFCSDKCQDIPWLKKVSTTFRYSALGVIFCCSSEEVKSSKRLDGFPDIDMNVNSKERVKNFKIHQELEDVTNSYELGSDERGHKVDLNYN